MHHNTGLRLIRQTHYFLRRKLENSLKEMNYPFNDNNYENFYEYWIKSYSDKFFDIGTFTRIGTTIELAFRDYYRERRGITNLTDLKMELDEISYAKGNIFQRVQKYHKNNGVVRLFDEYLKYDLEANPKFKMIQEIMINRHLYTHKSGLLDDKYIADLKEVTGEDLTKNIKVVNSGYPNQDVFWLG